MKGHPGSGKTTALLHAADSSGAEQMLYITYSRNLAALARDYFDRFCSSHKRFHVVTFPDLIRQVLALDAPVMLESEARQRFLRDLSPFSRTLGAGQTASALLRRTLCASRRRRASAYRRPLHRLQTSASIRQSLSGAAHAISGPGARGAALEAAARLEKLDPDTLAERYFPELALAWRAVERLRVPADGGAKPAH